MRVCADWRGWEILLAWCTMHRIFATFCGRKEWRDLPQGCSFVKWRFRFRTRGSLCMDVCGSRLNLPGRCLIPGWVGVHEWVAACMDVGSWQNLGWVGSRRGIPPGGWAYQDGSRALGCGWPVLASQL